jgi:hypothetical protein
MKRIVVAIAFAFIVSGLPGVAHADLDGLIQNLNVQAKVDMGKYSVQLATQFGVPQAQVTAIIRKVDSPADAFLCLQLGRMTNKDPERVLQTYQNHKGKGWGAIAKELGIKPGSPEFHALKRGDFALTGQPGGGAEHGHGNGGGHGQGHGRGHGRGNED